MFWWKLNFFNYFSSGVDSFWHLFAILYLHTFTLRCISLFTVIFPSQEFQDVDRTRDRPRNKANPEHPTKDPEHSTNKPEAVNKRALQIVNRVRDKLTGRDFNKNEAVDVDVDTQVDLLILQATSHANLCQAYIGWYACYLFFSFYYSQW